MRHHDGRGRGRDDPRPGRARDVRLRQDRDRSIVTFDLRAIADRTKERLASKAVGIGARDKAHGIEPMFARKALGLPKRLAGNGGDLNARIRLNPVKGQFVQRIGRGPVERIGNQRRHIIGRCIVGVEIKILDLLVGDDDLARQNPSIKRHRLVAQPGKRSCQIRVVKGDLAQQMPSRAIGTVQKADAFKGQGKGKVRFHR
ncbi:MAG: hypothetical protein COW54_02655 [Rhodobacteraceae bacterium CG17_big_fil_post_rev_8_21_14_2_50_63_15]|nr:MAG: hypothetical protein COW54_02655 [Rhodobacteraceae bacterium CG17_big_fil_post_rev_8_21_14_2_50_63_15]